MLRPYNTRSAKLSDDLPVMRLGEKLRNAFRQHRTDISNFKQRRRRRGHERIEASEVRGKRLCGRFTDVTDAQREDEPSERRGSASLDGGKDIGRRFVRH